MTANNAVKAFVLFPDTLYICLSLLNSLFVFSCLSLFSKIQDLNVLTCVSGSDFLDPKLPRQHVYQSILNMRIVKGWVEVSLRADYTQEKRIVCATPLAFV